MSVSVSILLYISMVFFSFFLSFTLNSCQNVIMKINVSPSAGSSLQAVAVLAPSGGELRNYRLCQWTWSNPMHECCNYLYSRQGALKENIRPFNYPTKQLLYHHWNLESDQVRLKSCIVLLQPFFLYYFDGCYLYIYFYNNFLIESEYLQLLHQCVGFTVLICSK